MLTCLPASKNLFAPKNANSKNIKIKAAMSSFIYDMPSLCLKKQALSYMTLIDVYRRGME